MQPHHFSSQTHDLESCPLREENRQLKKKLEDANAYAQTLEWARDKLQQENKDLSYHINYVLKKRISELEAMVPKWQIIEEKQPPKAINLLVYSNKFKRRGVQLGYIANDEWSKSITHWMPLPPPPTAKRDK